MTSIVSMITAPRWWDMEGKIMRIAMFTQVDVELKRTNTLLQQKIFIKSVEGDPKAIDVFFKCVDEMIRINQPEERMK